jgi:hypothetical protein
VNALQQRVRRIIEKLSEAKARGCSCFGSNHHRFRLNAPLEEAELCRFETAHGIELPACYRAFLRYAGNGGAGPYYGIFPLQGWNDFAGSVLDEIPAGFLATSSPLRPGPNGGLDIGSEDSVLAAYGGTLSVGTQGCTYCMQLIVTGPWRGRVAYVDVGGAPPFVVRDEDFLSWYERWLDELLNGYDTGWFGFSPPGGEGELLAILGSAEADAQLRGEAARAFRRLPRLSEPTTAHISRYLGDSVAEVRSGMCAAVREFRIGSAVERLADLLVDPAPEARQQAACTLVELAPQRWAEAVKRMMLRETDQGVAFGVFHSLKEAGRLDRKELLHVIETGRADRARASAVCALDWSALGAEHADLAARLLADPDRGVRFQATLGLRQSRLKLPASFLIACLEKESDPTGIDYFLELLGSRRDPAATEALLKWAATGDDFHRLCALKWLLRLGERRAIPVVRRMLRERRPPVRKDGGRLMSSSIFSIRTLVFRTLLQEPWGVLRSLTWRIWMRG